MAGIMSSSPVKIVADFCYADYGFSDAAESHMHRHFLVPIFELAGKLGPGSRVLDVGCGNGFTTGQFLARGCDVVGIDLSKTGIALARKSYPAGRFEVLPADARVLENLRCEPFDLVISTEVVEHLYALANTPPGVFALHSQEDASSAPLPTTAMPRKPPPPCFNKWDAHASPLWDGGHIKLWSRKTLSLLLAETGFTNLQFRGAGRLPGLWMTMVMSGDRPAS
jgi:SAM-dependent methyltransferase